MGRMVSRLNQTLLTTLLLVTTVAAQVPPPLPQPGLIPQPAPTPQVIPIPGVPLQPGTEPTVPLLFLDTDIKDILPLYEKWTGRRLIYSTQLVGPIRIQISGQVPQSEAIKIVEMTFALNGFYIVPSEDPKIWKVTGVGTNPKQVGIPFVDREEMLPAGEQIVMFLFKLKNADPTELAQTIQSGILVPNQTGAASVVALPRSQSLLVTDSTNIIRSLINIVRAIDVEPSEVISEFITLEHAQAEDVATALEKLFDKQQQSAGATGASGQPRAPRLPNAGAGNTGLPGVPGSPTTDGNIAVQINGAATGLGPTEDNIVIGKVRITADKRTNRLHVVTRPINIKLIRALVKDYDSQVPLAPPAVRPLRFRPVEEVIDAVIAAIADPGEKTTSAGGSGGSGAAGGTTPNQAPRPTGQSQTQGSFGSNSGSSAGGGSSQGETLSTTERDTQPVTHQVGKSTIIADKRANAIIVVGPSDVTEKVFSIIDKLDVRQAQVMIHTIVGELRLTGNEQFGIETILRNGGILPATTTTTTGTGTGTTGTTTTTSTAPVGFDSNGQAILSVSNLFNQGTITKALTTGGGGFGGAILVGSQVAAALKTLESSDRFRVLTRPSIMTSNNKRAVITSGEEVPVPTSIQSQFNNATSATTNNLVSNSSIQFKPIELRLEVLPLINSENEVSLEIVQNISERSGTTRIDNNDIPNISRRALKTYVTVPSNGTLILGGLIKESLDLTNTGVPKLSNLPLIGPLFGSRSKSKIRNELIVIMRPVVTVSPMQTAALREKTFEAFNIPPDLESAIMPQGIREKVKPAKGSTLRNSTPKLRDESSFPRRQ